MKEIFKKFESLVAERKVLEVEYSNAETETEELLLDEEPVEGIIGMNIVEFVTEEEKALKKVKVTLDSNLLQIKCDIITYMHLYNDLNKSDTDMEKANYWSQYCKNRISELSDLVIDMGYEVEEFVENDIHTGEEKYLGVAIYEKGMNVEE